MAALAFLETQITRVLPPELANASDEDVRRRARLVVSFSIAIFLCGPLYGAVYGLLGMPVSAVGAAVAAVVMLATPFLQRWTRSVSVGAHLVSFGSYAALALVTAPTGGLAAPAIAWLALIPVTALMLGGKRAGLVWSLLSLGTVAAYFAVEISGHTPPSEVPPAWGNTLRVVVNLGIVGIIALLTSMYEKTKDRMLAEARAANDALGRARDEAESAHRGGRLVLDHVAQGLLVADANGIVEAERSTALAKMLGSAREATRVWEFFATADDAFAARLEYGWEALFEDVLPFEVVLAQLPRTCRVEDRTLSVEYIPIEARGAGTAPAKMLVVVTDVTGSVRAREVEQHQREQIEVFKWIVRDRTFFANFYREAERLVTTIESVEPSLADRLRALHTLKGNASLFGLGTLALQCHEVESRVLEEQAMTTAETAAIRTAWRTTQAMIDPMLGPIDDASIVVDRRDYEALLETLAAHDPALHASVEKWAWEPIGAHLNRLAEQARVLSMRLHQRELDVVVEEDGTRLPPGKWSPFWAASAHFIRNAIDHGIEAPSDRVASGKAPIGKLSLLAQKRESDLVFDVVDDGRGIDWDRVRARAHERGLPVATNDDLERALFADGVTTRDSVTETSGRGVGMSAILESCQSLGGRLRIESVEGQGTRIHFAIPLSARDAA
jgi:hypothetical protein